MKTEISVNFTSGNNTIKHLSRHGRLLINDVGSQQKTSKYKMETTEPVDQCKYQSYIISDINIQ